MKPDELDLAQWRAVAHLMDVILERAPDFPMRNAERCMTRQAWGLALDQIEETFASHPVRHDAKVREAYDAADAILPFDEDGKRLPFGIVIKDGKAVASKG